MKKKTIFDIVNSRKCPLLEIERINELLNKSGGVIVFDEPFAMLTQGTPTSAIQYIDKNLFKSWSQRGTCIDCSDFARTLDIVKRPKTDDELNLEFILLYCEYAANMIFLLRQKICSGDKITNIVDAAEDNIKKFLGWYNYELKYFPSAEKVLVITKNTHATVVAENTENESLAFSIIEYNHYLLKGNIERKKEILLAMGSDLEPRRKEIALIYKKLENDIFFMLNNLNLRHNNRKKGDKNYIAAVANMRKNKLEKWYDELYQLMLTAYLVLDSKERLNSVDCLKEEINKE